MTLNLLYGGQELFESPFSEERPGCTRQKKVHVLSVAQDIVYGVSGGKYGLRSILA